MHGAPSTGITFLRLCCVDLIEFAIRVLQHTSVEVFLILAHLHDWGHCKFITKLQLEIAQENITMANMTFTCTMITAMQSIHFCNYHPLHRCPILAVTMYSEKFSHGANFCVCCMCVLCAKMKTLSDQVNCDLLTTCSED